MIHNGFDQAGKFGNISSFNDISGIGQKAIPLPTGSEAQLFQKPTQGDNTLFSGAVGEERAAAAGNSEDKSNKINELQQKIEDLKSKIPNLANSSSSGEVGDNAKEIDGLEDLKKRLTDQMMNNQDKQSSHAPNHKNPSSHGKNPHHPSHKNHSNSAHQNHKKHHHNNHQTGNSQNDHKNIQNTKATNNNFETPSGNEAKTAGKTKGTGYYPANNKMEGGFKDMKGNKLHTLQDFLDGKSPYVSVAMDKNLYKNGSVKYGDSFRIPELEKKYGREINFRAVDTGGAFTNKGLSRIDICTKNRQASLDPTLNGELTIMKA